MKLRTTAFAVVFMMSASVLAVGQVKKMTSAQFNAAMDAAFAASGAKARREITKSVTQENGKVTQTSTTTHEFLPPNRSRSHFLSDMAGNKFEREWMIIDGQRFTKSYGGEWYRDSPLPKPMKLSSSGMPEIEDDNIEHSSQSTKLLGKPVTMLKRVETAGGNEIPFTTTYIVYVSSDGTITKIDEKTAHAGKGNTDTSITTYEYNPKDLKIEVPIP